jgi:putative membrane protein
MAACAIQKSDLRRHLGAVLGAAGSLALLVALLRADSWGPTTHHMAVHILLMNALAPCLALALLQLLSRPLAVSGRLLAGATVLQLAVLWTSHAPALVDRATASAATAALLQSLLFLAALAFWVAVLAQSPRSPWGAVAALLISGKLFCLLGALMIFAGQPIFGHGIDHTMPFDDPMADQQAAGLLMVIACPLTYVVLGVALTAQWLHDLVRRDSSSVAVAADRG